MPLTNNKVNNKKDVLSQADFIEFLQQNPDIFYQQPGLLSLITLPDGRGASSLLERQIDVLRSKLQQMELNHQQLISVAKQNEEISDSFASITNHLIAYSSFTEFASQLPKALMKTFTIDEVCFKAGKVVQSNTNKQDQAAYDQAVERMVNKRTVCDNKLPSSVIALFFQKPVKSVALVPLKTAESNKPIGILALGSQNPEKYTPELGTAHLDKLGLMAGICLQRLQAKVL